MTSRERVAAALAHREPDCVPLDLGATPVSSMHVSSVYALRQALRLDAPGTPVKVVEPYQMLGEIAPDLCEALGVDVVGLYGTGTLFGFENKGWKPWTFHDGTPLLVPEGFNTDPEPDGSLLMYPQGDKSVPPCARMPAGGWYFDALPRQEPLDEDNLRLEDNLEEFQPISDSELEHFRKEAERLYTTTDKAILGLFSNTGFGDIALVPGLHLKHPKGIRDVTEWYISTVTRRDFIYSIFEYQCEIGLQNLEKLYEAVGERVCAVMVTATDFGMQTGPFCSPETYRDLYKPFHKRVNDWIHTHTNWHTFIHSCGSVYSLLEDFVEAGFEILNPVQTSAASMEPERLKGEFGDKLVFWGGGIDTQRTLPFGTPKEIKEEVKRRLEVFGKGGGFVFAAIHNIQARVPVENLLALFEAFKEYRCT